MSDIQNKIIPNGPLDTDSTDRAIAPGAVRDRLNGRVFTTEQSSDGSNENVRGASLIAHTLPAGTNKIIGSYEDKRGDRIIYFNFNSGGTHGIYQFFPNQGAAGTIETIIETSVLGFSLSSKITGINVVQSITGDLLYWVQDASRPRKINITKANDTNKKRKYNVFYKNNLTVQTSFPFNATTTIFDSSGNVVLTWVLGISQPTLEAILIAYIAGVPVNNLVTFASCHQFLTAEFVNTGGYTMTITTSAAPANQQRMLAVAENFYPLPFLEEFIDAIKYPSLCEPTGIAQQDTTRNLNLIQNKIFQFRIKLIYDDNEKSVWSPYSEIPDIPISCGAATTQASYNYIDLDFNDDRLFDNGSLSMLRRIEISVREHNNDKLKFVQSLDKWEFLLNQNTFRFYNDGIYSVIDQAEDFKNYDSLPLLAKSQEFVNNRLFYGGITEGYDPACIDAKLNLSYTQQPQVNTYSFSGRIYIKNLFANLSDYQSSQPIHNLNDNVGYVFGGFGNSDIVQTVGSNYKQTIPLGGFVMYLAGTKLFDVSKQPTFSTYGINQDANGVMDSDNTGNALILNCNSNNINNARQRKKIRCQIENGGIWSDFTITNIPPGKYVLRMASHLTTQADLASPSLNWQKTSTYTLQIAGSSLSQTEAQVEITTTGDIYIDGVFVASANGTIPSSQVADLTEVSVLSGSVAITGYTTDADITMPATPSIADLLGDTRIDLARVVIDYTGFNGVMYSSWAGFTDFNNNIIYTDHNGFFFWASHRNGVSSMKVNYVNVIGNQKNIASFTGYNMSAGAFVATNALGTNNGLFRIASASQYNNERTILQGNLSFNSQPIAGFMVVTTRGNFDFTDSNGDFNIIIYGDTKNFFTTGTQKTRADKVFSAVTGACLVSFSQNSVSYNVVSFGGLPNFNYTNPFPIVGITISNIIGSAPNIALKRGGKYKFGLVYIDNAGRDNNVNTSDQLNLKIPFYTEIVAPATTIVGQSAPIVEMEISSLPPSWATHYQIVRTLNGNQGKYLQWTAKTVTYVDDLGATTSFSQATQVKIDLEGTLCYKSADVDSLVSYQYEDGDRLVLIRNGATSNLYTSYIDFKIKGSKTGASLILYIENLASVGQIPLGTLFEIYNPNKKKEEELYYEIGECWPITGGFHVGNTQTQTATQPAKILISNGDTYYRLRSIPYDTTNTINSACNANKSWYIEDVSVSDFYKSDDQSIGRFHVYNKDLGQRRRETCIRFSNTFILETKINGLNSFEGLNEKVLPLDYGLIEKLILAKDTLCSIHNNSEFLSMYIGKEMFLDNQLQGVVAISDKVIQQSYQYSGGLGTQNPESICIDEQNTVYGYDNDKGVVWARYVNGIVPISEMKMRTYWKDKSAAIKSVGGTFVYGAYDNKFNQFLLSIEAKTSGSASVVGDTIAYSTSEKMWETRFSFLPEYFGGAKNGVLVLFRSGALWRLNSATYNNFFGQQFTSRIKVVSNIEPSLMKNFMYLSTESKDAWGTTVGGIRTIEGQISELAKTDFENIESVWRASFLQDSTTPNVATPLLLGDDLVSSAIILEMESDATAYSTLYAINVYSILSNSTNK